MSTRLSLKEALAPQVSRREESRGKSGSRACFALQMDGHIDRPVDLVRALLGYGVSLKRAHAHLERIGSGERVCLELWVDSVLDTQRKLKDLGVKAAIIARPHVSAAMVRRSLKLSQAEFALRFGLELRTVRNWEQGRNKPDPAVAVLLAIISKRPDVADEVMSDRRSGSLPASGDLRKPPE